MARVSPLSSSQGLCKMKGGDDVPNTAPVSESGGGVGGERTIHSGMTTRLQLRCQAGLQIRLDSDPPENCHLTVKKLPKT